MRDWALEMVGSPNPVQGQVGNFIITDKKGTEAQKFNIDGHMFQSMVNNWAIDIPLASVDPNGKDIYLYPQHGGSNQLWNVLTILLSNDGRSLLFVWSAQNCLFQSVISRLSLMEFMLTTVLSIPWTIIGAQPPGMWQIAPWCVRETVTIIHERDSYFISDSKAWGKCPSVIEPPENCSLNYERLADSCIRISTIALTWGEAEEKCKAEGGHLISITSSQTQSALMELIKLKIANNEKRFLPPYADEIENYWTGGTVRSLNDWRWISTLKNFSEFSLWKSSKKGFGCSSPDLCLETQALKISGERFDLFHMLNLLIWTYNSLHSFPFQNSRIAWLSLWDSHLSFSALHFNLKCFQRYLS